MDIKKDTNAESEESPLLFSKDGQPYFQAITPSAFAWKYPWPPHPTNLAKGRIFRPKTEQIRQEVDSVCKSFDKESDPMNMNTDRENNHSEQSTVKNLKVLLPEIELALYWGRHPYEFRRQVSQKKRSQSAVNLFEIDDEVQREPAGSKTTDLSSLKSATSNKAIIKNTNGVKIAHEDEQEVSEEKRSSLVDSNLASARTQNSDGGNEFKENSVPNLNDEVKNSNSATSDNKHKHTNQTGNDPLQIIKQYATRNDYLKKIVSSKLNPGSKSVMVANTQKVKDHRVSSNNESEAVDSTMNCKGVQVNFETISKAALMSTYLCPLHGQYQQKMEKQNKSLYSPLKPPKGRIARICNTSDQINIEAKPKVKKTITSHHPPPRLMKSVEIQTNDGQPKTKNEKQTNKKRAKSCGGTASAYSSEYWRSYRHPGHITLAEERRLRNKILSYCFTKHSIF